MTGISYETALELKNAGFPQGPVHVLPRDLNKEPVYTPTLSELIEVCGKPFELRWLPDWDKWLAEHTNYIDSPPEQGYGSTPEEAVARLWLLINKK